MHLFLLCAAMAVPPEGEAQLTERTSGRKDESAKESQPANESAGKVAPTDAAKTVGKEPPKEVVPTWGNPPVVLAAIGMALLVAIMQQEDIAAGRPMALFEPHVVPAPKADKHEVVIQFCQS